MSKLAHSNTETMLKIDFDRAIADGNEDMLAGYYWVRLRGELRVAEWRNDLSLSKPQKWGWDMTRGEVADYGAAVVIEPVDRPAS